MSEHAVQSILPPPYSTFPARFESLRPHLSVVPTGPSVRPVQERKVTDAEIREHMHLVYRVVAQMQRRLPSSVQRDDLLAAGQLGLLDALRKNAGDLDSPSFDAYTRIRIRGAILDELRLMDYAPRGARSQEAIDTLGTGVSVMRFDDLGIEEASPADHRDPYMLTESLHLRREVDEALAKLPERERRILDLRYYQEVPAKMIATLLGLSEARVSQLHARATATLRELLRGAAEAA